MSQYYFFVASLPMLQYDLSPGISRDAFDALCVEHLSSGDRSTLTSALLNVWDGEARHPLLLRWYRWEISIRNELVRLRAQARGVEAEDYLMQVPPLGQENAGADVVMCENLAREAFGQADPATAEESMNRGRWQFLEGLELGHAFDLERLLVYSIKLQLLERKESLTVEKGEERFQSMRLAGVEKIKAGEGLYE